MTSRLTLNLGLRGSMNRLAQKVRSHDPGLCFRGAKSMRFRGSTSRRAPICGSRRPPARHLRIRPKQFAPRAGFAYSLTKKTVLRGGYALSYIPVIGSVSSDGYGNETPWVPSADGGITIDNG